MAIVKMSKFSLLSFKSRKETLLETLHKFENVQFVNLQEKEEEDLKFFSADSEKVKISEVEEIQAKLKFCIDTLNKFSPKEGGLKALKEGKKTISYEELQQIGTTSHWQEYYKVLKENETKLNEIKNEKTKLNGEIEALIPWRQLDAKFSDMRNLRKVSYFLGSIPKLAKETFLEEFSSSILNSYVEFISDVKSDSNIFVLVHKNETEEAEKILKQFGFNNVNFTYENSPNEVIESLTNDLKELNEKEEDIKGFIKNYSENREEIEIVHEYYSNIHDIANASDNFLNSNNVLAIEGWVPTNLINKLEETIKGVAGEDYYLTFEDAQVGDPEVPILLKNNKIVKAFESITKMYSIPKYSEVDPTPLLTPFYLVFFGMMMADMGYGLLMIIASAIALKCFNLEDSKKDFIRFFFYLGFPTFIVGALYGGFFGDIIKGLKGVVDPAKDVVIILIVSMVLGLIQLYFGLGVKAYMLIKEHKPLDAVYDVFSWYAALTGALLLLGGGPLGLSPMVVTIGKWVMIVGMILIVLTGGRENKNIGARLGAGLYSLYGISGYVGDLVSYSRLMALGLAGGFIGSAFNLMISLLGNGPVKWIVGPIIFILGHVFNLLLSALGAYVHTCRLQYVEYFGKFYEGGGKEFKPFKSRNKFINIKSK